MSIAAFVIALISLIATIIFGAKNYRKSKRLEFFQRWDHLFQRIAELNAKNGEAHLYSARYELLAQNRASLRLGPEYSERNTRHIARIASVKAGIEQASKNWDENIEDLHVMCRSLTLKDTERVERLIAIVQIASDQLKKVNDISSASLHLLETTDLSLKADLDKLFEYEMKLAEIKDSKLELPSAWTIVVDQLNAQFQTKKKQTA